MPALSFCPSFNNLFDGHFWWLVRVTLVVAFAFLSQNGAGDLQFEWCGQSKVVATLKPYLLLKNYRTFCTLRRPPGEISTTLFFTFNTDSGQTPLLDRPPLPGTDIQWRPLQWSVHILLESILVHLLDDTFRTFSIKLLIQIINRLTSFVKMIR